jgi:hypothetical protein
MGNRAAAVKSFLRMKIENTSVEDVAREVFERIQIKTNMQYGKAWDEYRHTAAERVQHALVAVLGLELIEEWLEQIEDDYKTWGDQIKVLPYPDEEECDARMDELCDSLLDEWDEQWGLYHEELELIWEESYNDWLQEIAEELWSGWEPEVEYGASF